MELGSRPVLQIRGLHSEPAQDLAFRFVTAQILQGIFCPLQGNAQIIVCLFNLFITDRRRPVIRDRSSLDNNILLPGYCRDCLEQIMGTCDGHPFYAGRGLKADRAGYQGHFRAAQGSRPGDGISHLSAGMIGDKADRVNGFAGGSRCHQDLLPGQILFAGNLQQDPVDQIGRVRKLALAFIAAGQAPAGRFDDPDAALPQHFQIGLGGRMIIHSCIHGRRNKDRAGAGQQGGRKHIVGQSIGHLGNDIGSSRGYNGQIRLFGQRNMLHFKRMVPVKSIRDTFLPGQRLKSNG